MSQISFSEIVGMLDGNGFTNAEAMSISTKIVGLADRNNLWLQGLALQVAKHKDFVNFDPQNNWQRNVTKKLLYLTSKERQCFLLNTVQGYSIRKIAEKLKLTQSSIQTCLDNADDKLAAERPYIVTEDMLNYVSKRSREVYVLRMQHKMTYREIGEKLGISPQNSCMHFVRAKRRFRHYLNRGEEVLSREEFRFDP